MPKILLVEDQEMNRDMLSRRLTKRAYQVIIAVDGAEGLERTRSEAPELILMDMSLPVMDGWEATRQIKADKGGKSGDVEMIEEDLTDAAAHVDQMEVDLVLDRVVRQLRRAHHGLTQPAAGTHMNSADAPLADALRGIHAVMGQATVALD